MIIYNNWDDFMEFNRGMNTPYREIYKEYSLQLKQGETWNITIDTEDDLSLYNEIDLTFQSTNNNVYYLSAKTDYSYVYLNEFDGDVNVDFSGFTTGFSYNNSYLVNYSGEDTTMYINTSITFLSGTNYKIDFEVVENNGMKFDLYNISGLTGLTANSALTVGLYRYEFSGNTGDTKIIINIPNSGNSIDYVRVYEDLNNDDSITFYFKERMKLNININKDISKYIPAGLLSLSLGMNDVNGNRKVNEYRIGEVFKNFSRY